MKTDILDHPLIDLPPRRLSHEAVRDVIAALSMATASLRTLAVEYPELFCRASVSHERGDMSGRSGLQAVFRRCRADLDMIERAAGVAEAVSRENRKAAGSRV